MSTPSSFMAPIQEGGNLLQVRRDIQDASMKGSTSIPLRVYSYEYSLATYHSLHLHPTEEHMQAWLVLFIAKGQGVEWMGYPLLEKTLYWLPLLHTILTHTGTTEALLHVMTLKDVTATPWGPEKGCLKDLSFDREQHWTQCFHRVQTAPLSPGTLSIVFLLDTWWIGMAWRTYFSRYANATETPQGLPPLWIDTSGTIALPEIPAWYPLAVSETWQGMTPVQVDPAMATQPLLKQATHIFEHMSMYQKDPPLWTPPQGVFPLHNTTPYLLHQLQTLQQACVTQTTSMRVVWTCTSSQYQTLCQTLEWKQLKGCSSEAFQASDDCLLQDMGRLKGSYLDAVWNAFFYHQQPWRYHTRTEWLSVDHTTFVEMDEKEGSYRTHDPKKDKRLWFKNRICYLYEGGIEACVNAPLSLGVMKQQAQDKIEMELGFDLFLPVRHVWVLTWKMAKRA